MRLPWVLATILLLLAGCSGGSDGDDGNDDDQGEGGGGDGAGPGDRDTSLSGSGDPAEEGALEQFAVLVAEGRLEGEGPAPGAVVACTRAPPSGAIDLLGQGLWARPGQHDFNPGDTWIVILDRVVVDDPRGGCTVPKVTSFVFDAQWSPQLADADFRLHVFSDGDDLLIGKNPVEPGQSFSTRVEFEHGEYTFSGNLTLRHHDWWDMDAFEERDVESPPDDAGAIWWAKQEG